MDLFDVYPIYNITPIKAKGVYVYDSFNNKYLDLYGGHAVISIGHNNNRYIKSITNQINKIGFYSNAINNPLQKKLANLLGKISNCDNYQLFLCNSGAEAVENALKVASFHTNKAKVIAFKNSFHGRTSAALSVTDNKKIISKLNLQQKVVFLEYNDIKSLEKEFLKNDVCAIIFESIQGVGGLNEPSNNFVIKMNELCKKYKVCLIADEVQSGFSRTGDFFAFQKHLITPDIITMGKGMGNGFPVSGILINKVIKSNHGMLGTTFGGNHLACAASIAVLNEIKNKDLQKKSKILGNYFINEAKKIKEIKKIKGRGLMLGIEFEFEVNSLRKNLIYNYKIFTGGSSNKFLLRLLPPLTVKKTHLDYFFKSLKKAINDIKK
ncbi:MAG: aminotransferase class III-fold pyridoxal phosphate-dependent enzyme [Flavobacteriaceae bacterium]|nr:aminotransferase class III-fold pyridoxal phosphate-dependent enzyme [Flavobacteriaceae bacterium]